MICYESPILLDGAIFLRYCFVRKVSDKGRQENKLFLPKIILKEKAGENGKNLAACSDKEQAIPSKQAKATPKEQTKPNEAAQQTYLYRGTLWFISFPNGDWTENYYLRAL